MSQFDLIPSPSILDLLGRIPFRGSQCVAELIDNSIDAILSNKVALTKEQKVIHVTIPTKGRLLQNEPLVIEDWGIGMNDAQLQNAVKAGFSSKNTSANLGLFGMGFNVATSRLANTVQVWTSKEEMNEEIGVCIDLREMKRTGSFVRPRMSRSKRIDKKSGTRIEIYDFKPEAQKILKGTEIYRELNRAYSEKIFYEDDITIQVNGQIVKPFKFCTWDKSRSVKYKNEDIPAVIEIDEHLKDELFCENCFLWLGDPVDTSLKIECPQCQSPDNITRKAIHLSGWVGIQRFTDPDHYGIDISRNGRILSKLDKSLFSWDNNKEDIRFNPEYPRDTPQAGGRIVGQLEVNFVIPKYTKDDFEREDSNWRLAVNFLRGEMPLQPELAQQFDYFGRNRSPIGQLFSAYRKVNIPGAKTLIFANKEGGCDYVTPRLWAQMFYDGEPEYQNDSKWWDAVKKSELKESGSTFSPGKPLRSTAGKQPTTTSPEIQRFPGEKFLKTSKKYDLENILSEKPIEVTVIEYLPSTDLSKPIIFDPIGQAKFFAYINFNHPLFRDFADGYEDLILMEVASKYCLLKNNEDWPVTRIYYELKSRYASETMLNVPQLINRSNNLMREVQNFLIKKGRVTLEKKPILTDHEVKKIKKEALDLENRVINDINELIGTTDFIRYLDLNYLFKFIREYPSLFFDGQLFNLPYNQLGDEEEKMHQLEKVMGYFNDVKWFINELSRKGDESIRKLKSEIIRNRMSVEYLYGNIVK